MCFRTNAPCLCLPRRLVSAFFGSGLLPRRRASSPPPQASWMDDRRKRQTSTATPAEPGDLPWVLGQQNVHSWTRGAAQHRLRRVDEDVATLIPHRSGRAVFPLPVLHGRASLTDVVADTIPDSPVKKVAEVKRHPSFRSCQFSYPLSFRGQVCETQSSLPCCPSTVLSTWHPSFLERVPVSPVPRCHRSY